MAAFLEMGGYGSFIWSSYGITLGSLIWLFLTSWRRAYRSTQKLQDFESSKPTKTD